MTCGIAGTSAGAVNQAGGSHLGLSTSMATARFHGDSGRGNLCVICLLAWCGLPSPLRRWLTWRTMAYAGTVTIVVVAWTVYREKDVAAEYPNATAAPRP